MTIWQLLGAIGISLVGCALLLDWDWKRKLFETHQERMARDPKYRDKELRHVRERWAHWYRLKAEEAEREGNK